MTIHLGGKIVVGLDGSERAAGVLAAAAKLAETFGAELLLVRALSVPYDLPAEALKLSPDKLEGILEARAKLDLEEQTKLLPKTVRTRSIVRPGSPWEILCEVAREASATLIVIGSHGYGGLDRILGTTAARVVNHADRSVFVVRAPTPEKEASHG